MNVPIDSVDSAAAVVDVAQRLRERSQSRAMSCAETIAALERWGANLRGSGIDSIPGVPFLRLWLRRGTLEPIIMRELGREALESDWSGHAGSRLGIFPLGVIGHWPAGNIEIQPLLSLSCSLLGENAAIVRVPTGLVEETRAMVEKLVEVDEGGRLSDRIAFVTFDHGRLDLHQALAGAVDGAMIWGGREAVMQLRALPFPPWARVVTFGPRISVAALDADTWDDEAHHAAWSERIARDVWQFDQQACSSPQTLFLERRSGRGPENFIAALGRALEAEDRAHPRSHIEPGITSAICLARATWLLGDRNRGARFSRGPEWTILIGEGVDIPEPVQGRTLTVLVVDSLFDPIARFGGRVQTLGLAVGDERNERALARAAAMSGVDRIVKPGRMHVFGSPWDGSDLVRPMVRIVRHVSAHVDCSDN